MPDDVLMTTEDVSALTHLPIGTLYQYRHHGQGPPSFRLGTRVVYRRSVVLAWIAEREAAEDRYAAGESERPARRRRSVTEQRTNDSANPYNAIEGAL